MTDGDQLLLFDMDGVILEGHGTDPAVHDDALDEAIAEAGLSVDDDTRSLLAGYEYDTEFVRGCERLGIDPVAFYRRRERHSASHTIDRLAAGDRTLYPDSDALDGFTDDYTLGLISNNYDAVVEFVVDHYDLDGFAYAAAANPVSVASIGANRIRTICWPAGRPSAAPTASMLATARPM